MIYLGPYVLGIVILSTVLAAVAAVVALLWGSGPWIALLIYSIGGATTVCVLAFVVARRSKVEARHSLCDDPDTISPDASQSKTSVSKAQAD
ncbi:hypothetical protein BWR18_05460 [Tateyamaria omphalii]|uniref:Uncharacterized protein n=1 Tax=Tateyamaria omphalii TaxID=299262 RepID=A0A1P8MT20_9RHOB|nr:hypothetical protein BWR18_05460 [Tateyamaria omphalii]